MRGAPSMSGSCSPWPSPASLAVLGALLSGPAKRSTKRMLAYGTPAPARAPGEEPPFAHLAARGWIRPHPGQAVSPRRVRGFRVLSEPDGAVASGGAGAVHRDGHPRPDPHRVDRRLSGHPAADTGSSPTRGGGFPFDVGPTCSTRRSGRSSAGSNTSGHSPRSTGRTRRALGASQRCGQGARRSSRRLA
jgi:hypothetical protein